MKVITILSDSVNRRYLEIYNRQAWAKTPNISRLAERSAVFESHWCGSAPCMPARRDLLTGRLNFLERNWGPIEPFDDTLPQLLRREKGVFSHMVTDHYHYFETGGENYNTAFNTWDFIRGQEYDGAVSRVNSPRVPEHRGILAEQYLHNLTGVKGEEDYPSPHTFQNAIQWLRQNEGADDFFLWIECFDPHEPFNTPPEYREQYQDIYRDTMYMWPEYDECGDTPEQLEHIRKRYAASLTMTDVWLGKLLDLLDEQNLWQDTMILFTTDHGYLLGEHGFMAKNYMPAYNEIFHIPLLIHMPGQTREQRIGALTQSVDLFPTIAEAFGVGSEAFRNPLHGRSLLPLIRGEVDRVRDCAIYGYFGMSVNLTDGRYTYFRAMQDNSNEPLNLYTAAPTTLSSHLGCDAVKDPARITLDHLAWTDYPVLKIPCGNLHECGSAMPFIGRTQYNRENLLFDLERDYEQNHPLADKALEQRYIALLERTMTAHDAPEEQFARLGI